MHPKGASKNRDDHAIFSNDGPNLINPDVTSNPKVIPKIYKHISKYNKGGPSLKIETPKRGMDTIAAGTNPIIVLKTAVIVRAVMISLIFIGAIKRLVKFLLQISSKNIIL